MRLLFAGSGSFGTTILNALIDSPHRIASVLSRPDRPAGRNRIPRPSAVASRAVEEGLPLHCPEDLDDTARAALAPLHAEALIVADYGKILPPSWLTLCPGGCLNVHPSLLPRWRGAAPIARALEAGDTRSGCTLMLMDEGLDTGDILAQETLDFSEDENAESAGARLGSLGGRLLLDYLESFDPAHPVRRRQDRSGACMAPKLEKSEAVVDWNRPAGEIARHIRAFRPAPVATSHMDGETVRLWDATALAQDAGAPPGTILGCDDNGLRVAAGDGTVAVRELQRPGRKRLAAEEFCRGVRWIGRVFT